GLLLRQQGFEYSQLFGSQRRSKKSIDKPFKCDYEGCERTYFQKSHLYHHQTQKHGRMPKCRRERGSDINRQYYNAMGIPHPTAHHIDPSNHTVQEEQRVNQEQQIALAQEEQEHHGGTGNGQEAAY
ncbi:hypothetical protein CAPTEDRAFT_205430, partial [Capitella teleta]